jgi:hypothetical protein
LEFNTALKKCGFDTKPKTIKTEELAKVNVPSIVLNGINKNNKPNELGHYFIVIPKDKVITIYDYPNEVQALPVDYLISVLKQKEITEFPIILCEPKEQIDRMKSPISTNDKYSKGTIKNLENLIEFKEFGKQITGEFDFGKHSEGRLVECTINIINSSADEIRIKSLEADCRCSEIQIDKKVLKPNESCKIRMDISLAQKYKDVAVRGWGTIEKVDSTKSSKIMLFVKGYSEPRVLCEPQKLDFGVIKSGNGTQKFENVKVLKTIYAGNQNISKIEPTSTMIKIENTKEYDNTIQFDVILNSSEFIGLENSKINVFMNKENKPAIYFDVRALLKSDFQVSPKTMIIDNKANMATAIIKAPDNQKFEIKHVKINYPDIFKVSYENIKEYCQINVSIRENNKPQMFLEDQVVVDIEMDSKNHLLTIPLLCIP